MPGPWGSVDEVASHLGVAKDSIYRGIETKDLPADAGDDGQKESTR